MSDFLSPGAGPAGPQLTPAQWAHVEALCIVNANRANAPIRAQIAAYFRAVDQNAQTAGQMHDPYLAPTPPRGVRALAAEGLPTAKLWHSHPFRGQTDRPLSCGTCGYARDTAWHTDDAV